MELNLILLNFKEFFSLKAISRIKYIDMKIISFQSYYMTFANRLLRLRQQESFGSGNDRGEINKKIFFMTKLYMCR